MVEVVCLICSKILTSSPDVLCLFLVALSGDTGVSEHGLFRFSRSFPGCEGEHGLGRVQSQLKGLCKTSESNDALENETFLKDLSMYLKISIY